MLYHWQPDLITSFINVSRGEDPKRVRAKQLIRTASRYFIWRLFGDARAAAADQVSELSKEVSDFEIANPPVRVAALDHEDPKALALTNRPESTRSKDQRDQTHGKTGY